MWLHSWCQRWGSLSSDPTVAWRGLGSRRRVSLGLGWGGVKDPRKTGRGCGVAWQPPREKEWPPPQTGCGLGWPEAPGGLEQWEPTCVYLYLPAVCLCPGGSSLGPREGPGVSVQWAAKKSQTEASSDTERWWGHWGTAVRQSDVASKRILGSFYMVCIKIS